MATSAGRRLFYPSLSPSNLSAAGDWGYAAGSRSRSWRVRGGVDPGLVAGGPRAGQAVRRLRTAAAVVDQARRRCARLAGFSRHAIVAVPAHARGRLEHLCRDLLGPSLAGGAVAGQVGRQVLYELAHPRADGVKCAIITIEGDSYRRRVAEAKRQPPKSRPAA